MKGYLFNIISLLIISTSTTSAGESRFVIQDTPLYLGSNLEKQKVRLLKDSKLEVIESKNNKIKIRIIHEPFLQGRRNRSGETGWISINQKEKRTRRAITKDDLFGTVQLSRKVAKATQGPIIKRPCTDCDLAHEKQKYIEERKESVKNPIKYQKGCEELKKFQVGKKNISSQKLKTCVNSIIKLAKSKSKVKGYYRGIGKKRLRKVSRHKFYSSLAQSLNPLEEDFIGHILTAAGEADSLVNQTRLNPPKKPPHYQEMMAINLVLENRKRSAIASAKEYQKDIKEIRKRFGLNKNVSLSKIINKIIKEKKRLENQSTRLSAKEAKRKMPKIKAEIKRLRALIGKLKTNSRSKMKTSVLDVALDKSQFSIYLDKGVNKRAKSHEPNYPHWFKIISTDYSRARDNAISAFIKFNKTKPTLPQNVKYYYAHTSNKRSPPKWALNKSVKSAPLRFKIGRKTLRLNSDPIYSNIKGKNATYKCGVKRQGNFKQKKAGHCFFSGRWNYYGHTFGG